MKKMKYISITILIFVSLVMIAGAAPPEPPPVGNVTVKADRTSLIADGVSTSTITVTGIKDADRNDVLLGDITLVANTGTIASPVTITNGTATSKFTSGTEYGDAVITATYVEGDYYARGEIVLKLTQTAGSQPVQSRNAGITPSGTQRGTPFGTPVVTATASVTQIQKTPINTETRVTTVPAAQVNTPKGTPMPGIIAGIVVMILAYIILAGKMEKQ